MAATAIHALAEATNRPAPAAHKAAAAAEQECQLHAEPSRSTQGVVAQLSPEIVCLSLGVIIPLLPADSAPSSPAASDGVPHIHDVVAAKQDSGCHPATTLKARCHS